MIKTSAIIPVYNTQEYIGECLECLFKQTQKEIEIIAVNDGSTDNSLEILKEYQKEHDNLIIINQENKKLGAARNAGMRIAKGECIYFLDSDDLIEKDTLEILYRKVTVNRLDFVSFDAGAFGGEADDAERFKYYDRSEIGIDTETVYTGFDFWNQFYASHDPMVTAWSFYFKKEFLDKYHFEFQENLFYEDSEFAVKAYMNAERMMYEPRKLYYRRIRQGSIMLSKFDLVHLRGHLSNTKLICKYINDDMHEIKRKELFIRFWRAQFQKVLRRWSDTEAQKDEDTLNLAGEIVTEIVHSTFISQYLDMQFYQELHLFLKFLLEEAFYPAERNELLRILKEWHDEKTGLCIYGTGKIAEKIISMIEFGEIKRNRVVFAVTENREGAKEYHGFPLIEIKDLQQYEDITDILVASTKYEDEMLEELQKLFDNTYQVATFREVYGNQEKKVSIIVPVYNGEKYLRRCISSLVQQMHKNIEIIIVNDGSTDKTLSIIMKYVENDKRCIIINQKNQGVTIARKEGLRRATGDFVVFVDSDDWAEPDMVGKMLAKQSKTNADIICMGHIREMGDEQSKEERGQISQGVYAGMALKIFYKKMFYVSPESGWGIWPALWAKLYKKDIIKNAIEKADERIIYGEDAAIMFSACFDAEKIAVDDSCLYHYFTVNESSVSKSQNKYLLENMYYLYNYMKNLFEQQDEKDVLIEQLEYYMGNLMNHAGRVLFNMSCYFTDLFWAKKEAEQWKIKYDSLRECIEKIVGQHEWLVPFEEIKDVRNILLIGMKDIMEDYEKQLRNNNKYKVVALIEDLCEIEKISGYQYDGILIATNNIKEKCYIELELLKKGISEKKIIWKEPVRF